jgi:hypothetical protein
VREARRPESTYGLLTLRDAEEKFGLPYWQIYAAVDRQEVHAMQRNGAGRVFYPEWELEALAERHGYHRPCYLADQSGHAA